MNITLIEPPRYYAPGSPISTVVIPPLGPAYIAASLEAAGHRVHVVDAIGQGMTMFTPFRRSVYLRGLSIDRICKQIPADTQLIGISCMFSAQWLIVRELVKALKRAFPRVPVVLGGEHGTGMPDLSMAQAPLDYIVTGEGEETIVELVHHLEAGFSTDALAGTVVRTPEGVKTNPRRNRIASIDALPLPAWHLFDVDAYIAFNQPHGASRGRFIPMLATRGCPFQCTFCTSSKMWTTKWIARDYNLVVDEMERWMQRYHVTDFHFEDLTAIIRKEWILKFCETITARGLQITFQLPSGTRSEAVDVEAARALKRAGCHEFSFAPESGDPGVLKSIKKQVSLPKLFESARSAMQAGINVGGFFIVGFPEDTYMSVFRTLRTIAKCAIVGFSSINVNPYSPQPNTESFHILRAEGKIGELDDDYFINLFRFQDLLSPKVSYNTRFGPRRVTCFVLMGFIVFYTLYFLTRPRRIVTLIRDLFRKSSSDKSARAFSNLVKDYQSLGRTPVRAEVS